MHRRWKILIGCLAALAVLLTANAILTSQETKGAEVTVPGGELVALSGGSVQVAERGPRRSSPIVLIHCFTCAIDWWDRMAPYLARRHRVIIIDLLGHGGAEKPDSGYSMENQANLVAGVLRSRRVSRATVVGHSLGGVVATALLEQAPELVARLVIVDQAPDSSFGDLDLLAKLSMAPLIGQAAWRLAPDSSIEDGLSQAFAPGFNVPNAYIEDFRRLTFSAYERSAEAETSYSDERPLDERIAAVDIPLLIIFGAEEQIYDPRRSLRAYATTVPGAQTRLIPRAGHSPSVERPAATAALVLRFTNAESRGSRRTKKGRPNGRPK